jgi:hypothetical protein
MINYFKRINYFFTAQTAHGLHSPFVFQLYSEVLNPHLQKGYNFDELIIDLEKYFQLSTVFFSNQNEEYSNKLILVDKNNLEQFFTTLNENLIQFPGSIILIKQPHIDSEKYWKEIIRNPKINFSIDIFDLGILTIDKIAPKQDFKLKMLR